MLPFIRCQKDWYFTRVGDRATLEKLYKACFMDKLSETGLYNPVPGIDFTCDPRQYGRIPPMRELSTVMSIRFHLTHAAVMKGMGPDFMDKLIVERELTPRFKTFMRSQATKHVLRPYQRESAMLAMQRSGCLIADDLGLGKTLTALLASSGRTMIVCPLSAISVWESQIAQWLKPTPKVAVLTTDISKIEKEKKADFFILPYSALAKHGGYFHASGTMEALGTIIADEAHIMALKSTHWAKVFKSIGRERTILLTGTPMRNKLASLWGLLDIMNPGAWGSLYDFRIAYCGASEGHYGLVDGKPTRTAELAKRLAPVFIKHTREQAGLDIPTHERRIITIPASIDDRREMKTHTTSLSRTLTASGDCLRVLTALRHAVGVAKLRYLTLEVLAKLQDEFGMVVYWVWHKDLAKELEYRLKQLNKGRVDILTGETQSKHRKALLERWSHASTVTTGALVMGIAAGSTAISLNRARAAVFVELDWGTYQVMQAEKRHHRFGSIHQKVTTVYLVMENTADETMCHHILDKAEQSEAVLGKDGQVDLAEELLRYGANPLKAPFHSLLERLDAEPVPDPSDVEVLEQEEDWPVWVNEKEWV